MRKFSNKPHTWKGERLNRIGGGGQREKTDTTEEKKDQVYASAEDSEIDQMTNVPNEKKNEQLKGLEEDADEIKDQVPASADSEIDQMINDPNEKKNEQLERLEEDAGESKDEK